MKTVEDIIKEVKSFVEADAEQKAIWRLNLIKKKRGGKFKLSEKQFREEIELAWISGEFSNAERVLRFVEMSKEIENKDDVVAAIQLHVLDLIKIVNPRINAHENISLEDILPTGRFSSANVLAAQLEQ